jgi:hypothetical protein
MNRSEDVGHAHVVVKFMSDARDDGYGISEAARRTWRVLLGHRAAHQR